MRLIIAGILMCSPLCAQPDAPAALNIPRVSRAPKLADFINSVPREAELVVTDFRQFDPRDGAPVSEPTTAYLSYDDKNLYVGWFCKDDPKLIRSRVARRKDILWDDRVTINIDTFGDRRHSVFFDVNAHGVQFDGTTTDGFGDDFSWETLWYTEARITAGGYYVLETIPFKSLRFPDSKDQHWNIALCRMINRNNETSCWPHISRKLMPNWVGQFKPVEGLRDISAGRNIQVIPYVAGSSARVFNPGVPAYMNERELRGGVDAKAIINDSLTLDMTLNPDFSQVEVDEPQVTVNQRFEVFFPERRPFFIENASFFNTPEQLFFSRRIIDPQFGTRLTGKIGRWGVGVLAADDRAPQRFAGQGRATNGVIAVQREILRDSHIGVLASDRERSDGHNRVASLDARIRLPRNWFFTGQAVRSDTKSQVFEGQGSVYLARMSQMDRHWRNSTTYTDRSPGFRTELGFIPRVDIRQLRHVTGYQWRPKKGKIVSYGPLMVVSRIYNHAGQLTDWSYDPSFSVSLPRLTTIDAGWSESFELFQGVGFRQHQMSLEGQTEWFKWLASSAEFESGRGVNYYPAAGLKPSLADSTSAEATLTLRPTSRLRLDEMWIYSRLATPESVIFTNHIVRLKANYQFTREFALRFIADYNAVLPDASRVALERENRMRYDVLFTWLLHPGTAVYAGYTDLYENYLYDPSRPPYLQRSLTPGLSTGRQAFVKLSYLFRF